MKYVVFTFSGYGLPIAWQLQKEGQDVLVAQVQDEADILTDGEQNVPAESMEERERRLSLYDGLLDKCPAKQVMAELRSFKQPQEFFAFFDLNHLFKYAEQVRDLGCKGNFPTQQDFEFEINREWAKDFVASHYKGITVGHHEKFSTLSEAKAFLAKSEDLWVLKGLKESARTVVPDVEDLSLAHEQVMDALQRDRQEYESEGFILELLIRDAMELTPAKMFYDGEPITTYMCIENKAIGAGNIGPMTDCAQDLIFETEMSDRVNQIAFPPIVDEMARSHRGLFWWDASLYADPRSGKIYFGEFCPNRPGYNSLYTEIALAGSAKKYFESAVAGRSPYEGGKVSASVRLFSLHRDEHGKPVPNATLDYKDRIDADLWMCDVRQDKERLVSCGYSDTVGVMTGAGHSVREAARRAYRSIGQFSFEGAYYRPTFDFLSTEYKSSIVNRLNYGLERGLFKAGFGVC